MRANVCVAAASRILLIREQTVRFVDDPTRAFYGGGGSPLFIGFFVAGAAARKHGLPSYLPD